MQKFLDGLGFSQENPSNAAIEILKGNESQDVMVLFEPVYDAANRTLQYSVSILEEPNHSYATFNERHDKSLPEHFGPAALFIDDCSDCYICCYRKDDSCPGCYRTERCWFIFCCRCNDDDTYYLDKCKDKYGDDVYYFKQKPL